MLPSSGVAEEAARRRGFEHPHTAHGGARVSGPAIRERGLFMDWIQLDADSQARLWLTGAAAFRPAALVGLVFLVLWTSGIRDCAAASATAPLALGLALALLRDPWLVHRLLTLLPETLLFVALPLSALGRLLVERRRLNAMSLRAAVGLATLAFLVRASALNHPDFFYPDLRIHARLINVVGEAGWDFLRAPARYLYTPREESAARDTLIRATSGLWLRRIGGVDVGLPYSLALHSLMAPLDLSADAKITALKLLGALFSILPVAVLSFLAPRLGAPPLSALLLVAAPIALVELSLGTVPAVFGHALDVLLLLWLFVRAPRLDPRRLALEGALALALVQLAYVSSVLTTSVLVGLLVIVVSRGSEGGWPRARGLAFALLGGSLLALAVYYRDFVPGALAAVRLSLAGRAPGPRATSTSAVVAWMRRFSSGPSRCWGSAQWVTSSCSAAPRGSAACFSPGGSPSLPSASLAARCRASSASCTWPSWPPPSSASARPPASKPFALAGVWCAGSRWPSWSRSARRASMCRSSPSSASSITRADPEKGRQARPGEGAMVSRA